MQALRQAVKLSSGHQMPLLGLGTWQMDKGVNAVDMALEAGYRHIDTAFVYKNEEEVGASIARWLKKDKTNTREDLFVTTKLPSNCMSACSVERVLRKSLQRLGLSYVDLYLIHGPVGLANTGNDDEVFVPDENGQFKMDFSTDHIAIWKTMEKMVAAGLTKSIGVSNYSVKQLRKTVAVAKIPPAVQQIELQLRYQQPEMLKFCNENNIIVTSYGSLGSPGRQGSSLTMSNFPKLFEDPVVQLVAANHCKTPAQVALKFWVQQNVIVIPKSNNKARIVANSELFGWELTDTEMAALKSLDRGLEGKSFLIPQASSLRMHPEFSDNY